MQFLVLIIYVGLSAAIDLGLEGERVDAARIRLARIEVSAARGCVPGDINAAVGRAPRGDGVRRNTGSHIRVVAAFAQFTRCSRVWMSSLPRALLRPKI